MAEEERRFAGEQVCYEQAARIFAEGNNLRCFEVSLWQRDQLGRPVARVVLNMAK